MKVSPIFPVLFTLLALRGAASAQQPTPAAAQIQSVNWKVAVQMAQTAYTHNDVATLVSGLKHPVEEVRKQCASDLQSLGASKAVPALITAWTSNRIGRLGPNSVTVQQELEPNPDGGVGATDRPDGGHYPAADLRAVCRRSSKRQRTGRCSTFPACQPYSSGCSAIGTLPARACGKGSP